MYSVPGKHNPDKFKHLKRALMYSSVNTVLAAVTIAGLSLDLGVQNLISPQTNSGHSQDSIDNQGPKLKPGQFEFLTYNREDAINAERLGAGTTALGLGGLGLVNYVIKPMDTERRKVYKDKSRK